MSFWRKLSPKRAAEDFAHEWSKPTPHRWQILGVAVAATFALMMLMIPASQRADPERPTITYITSYAPGRTEEEIVASNIANQKRKEEREALLARRDERRKELYRALGRATGVDVDKMEAQIRREEAEEAAAAEAARLAQTTAAIRPSQSESAE